MKLTPFPEEGKLFWVYKVCKLNAKETELEWEINGYEANVVFSCGQAVIDGKIYVYYGGADTVIGVAQLTGI